jgi:hypothetical protein
MIDTLIYALDIIISIFPYYGRKRQRKKEWYGFVEEKKRRSDYSLSKHRYSIVFETDGGQKKKIKVEKQELFDNYKKGRRYHKKKGEYYPDPVE